MFGRQICLLRPPTIIFRSTGVTAAGELPPPALFGVPPHAANAIARAVAPPTAKNARRLDPYINRFSSLNRYFAADSTGSPFDEPVFESADQALRDQREDRQDEHAGEHAVDVEGVPRVVDELAETSGGPEQFPDHGADDRQPEADVEAGQNPRHRRRDDDLGRQTAIVRPENPCIRDQVAVDLADTLEGVEEDDEEDEHHGGRRLAPNGQTEHDREQRAEYDAWDRVRRLDEGRKHLGQQLDATEEDAEDDAETRADEEAEDGLLHGHGGLQPEWTQCRPISDPGPEPRDDAGRLAHEEGVNPVHAGR